MTLKSFPVIIGPKKAFNYQESKKKIMNSIEMHNKDLV